MRVRRARWEVVHTGPRKFHSRFRARNGQIVWVTESYTERATAWNAIRLIEAAVGAKMSIELREIDERTT